MAYRLRWSTVLPSPLHRPPQVGAQTILFESAFHAGVVDRENGRLIWQQAFQAPSRIAWAVPDAGGAILGVYEADHARVVAVGPDGTVRFSRFLEGASSEARMVGTQAWVLVAMEGGPSRLIRLDPAGSATGVWEAPAGAMALTVGEGELLFIVPETGVFRFDLAAERVERLRAGAWDWVKNGGRYRIIGNEQRLVVLDAGGRLCWQREGLGEAPAVAEAIYVCEKQGETWRPSCLDLATGARRWATDWKGVNSHFKMIPMADCVALWNMGNVELLDRSTGVWRQTLVSPSDWFSAVAEGEGMILAAEATLCCYEAA